MRQAVEILALVIAAALFAGAARRLGKSPPLLLVVVGFVASQAPGVPEYGIDPDLILVGVLPPLLYATALRTSLVDVRANNQAIPILSIGAVVFTTVAVGAVTALMLPDVPLAAAFALGAVVSPPDAVAATAVARRVGMPRRLVSILEHESLLNDATALVALRTAIAAISVSVTAWEVGWDFIVAAGGGVAVGLGVAVVLSLVRKQVTDPVLDTTLSFAAPFLAYLPAEAIHASGVVAVVVTGLVLGHKSQRVQTAASRLSEQTNWRTVQFILENTVFLLIGLQVTSVIEAAGDSGLGTSRIVLVCLAVLAATIAARIVWVLGWTAAYHFGPPPMRRRAWPWPHGVVVSWAGMRGVVTLAAVFLLPRDTPSRDVLVLAAFVVVAGTLLIQGPTLPTLVRRLGLPGPDPAEDALQEAELLSNATRAGLARLDELRDESDYPDVLKQLEARAKARANAAWERLGQGSSSGETPSENYRRLRLEMLEAERATVLQARDNGTADEEILREVLTSLDAEESMLDRLVAKHEEVTRELTAREDADRVCEHLREAPTAVRPTSPDGCEECLRDGTRWVHLRLCLSCGHVGCCDSSQHKHADKHYAQTEHPVMRSFEPGEAWRWCYPDEQLG